MFSSEGDTAHGGIAIGEKILDICAALGVELFSGFALEAAQAASGRSLNAWSESGPAASRALRRRVMELPDGNGTENGSLPRMPSRSLHVAARCTKHLPARVGDFTDFFAGIRHAYTAGTISRPENSLMPKYKYVPAAYHRCASSVRPSGGTVGRANGQRKPPEQSAPDFGACRNLDYKLELGLWVGPGNEPGTPIPIAEASSHIAGFCLLKDWSSRDTQSWGSLPLRPLLGKSLATFVSPWIVTTDALTPFRIVQPPRPAGDPAPLPHLNDPANQANGCFSIDFEVLLVTPKMRAAGAVSHVSSRSTASELYWTVAHRSSNGCNLQPGDLFGNGTISGTAYGLAGCLLEMTRGGRNPLTLPNGETRTYLEDGDEVVFHGQAHRTDYASIGFGECRGTVTEALKPS